MLIPCEECKKKISSEAAACPSCGHPVRKEWVDAHTPSLGTGCLAAAIVLVGVVLFMAWNDDEPAPAAKSASQRTEGPGARKDSGAAESPSQPAQSAGCGHEIEALTLAQIAVERKLKSPADAEFPWPGAGNEVITKMGECDYAVKSYVDALNSLGATVRTHFVVRLRYDREREEWIVREVRFAK